MDGDLNGLYRHIIQIAGTYSLARCTNASPIRLLLYLGAAFRIVSIGVKRLAGQWRGLASLLRPFSPY